MTVLGTNVVRDDAFARREEAMQSLVAELRERTAHVALGGGEAAMERHRSLDVASPPRRRQRGATTCTAGMSSSGGSSEFSAAAIVTPAWRMRPT